MRIWLKPDRLAQLKLTPGDVIARGQRAERAVRRRQGRARRRSPRARTSSTRSRRRAASPTPRSSSRSSCAPIRTARRCGSPTSRASSSARKDYEFIGRYQRQAGDARRHLPVAGRQRARGREERAQATMAELATRFPEGFAYAIPYDTTRFVEVSIREVLNTLGEAMILVFLVVYLFLQSWRATIIPFVAVPVSLIGTFAGLLRARLLDQHADAVRHGAGDRHRRRRRDRRAGERRAHHARGRAAAARGGDQGDARGDRARSSRSC